MGSSLNGHLPGLSVNFERKSFFLFNGKDQSRLNCFSLFYRQTCDIVLAEEKRQITGGILIDEKKKKKMIDDESLDHVTGGSEDNDDTLWKCNNCHHRWYGPKLPGERLPCPKCNSRKTEIANPEL